MMENLRKKITAVILVLAMAIGLMPVVTTLAYAETVDDPDPVAESLGAPPTEFDYVVNGSGFDWTGSDETIVLSGSDDILTINSAPSDAIKIDVQSNEDTAVTINGNSIACAKTYLVVSNKITLTLNDLDITAPLNTSALQINLSDGEDGMTLDVSGSNSLTGTGSGDGIRSDQSLNIIGSGTLKLKGGGNVSGSDGGGGISLASNNGAIALTIDEDVTVNANGGSSLTHSGGAGISVVSGDIIIKKGIVNATSGESEGVNDFSCGIMAKYKDADHSIGGNISVEGGTVTARGGNAKNKGAYGIYTYNKLSIKGGSVNAYGGNSVKSKGGTGAMAHNQNLEVSSGSLNASGGRSEDEDGGIAISNYFKDIIISGGEVNAQGGESTTRGGGNGLSVIGAGKLQITGGSVTVKGGNSVNSFGGAGVRVDEENLEISGGSLNAAGGNSGSSYAGAGVDIQMKNLEVSGGRLNASGGKSESGNGGPAIRNMQKDIVITGGTVTATGGPSKYKDGGRGLNVDGTGNLMITGGSVTATGGNGGANGAHAVFVNLGTIDVDNSANLTAVGGNGASGVGGAGMRAAGYDGAVLSGNTVTITSSAGSVYVRGGQGISDQRASIMGKAVYLGTGNIGSVMMEGSNPRLIKNTVGGDNVYRVQVMVDPAAAAVIESDVTGTLSSYKYRSPAKEDGIAYLWLPAGSQTVSATGYKSGATSIATDDISSVTLAKESDPVSTGGGKGGSIPAQTNAVVEVNGQKQDAGTAKTETISGRTVTTIKVDDAKLENILRSAGTNATVTLPSNTSSNVVVGELNGQTVKNMEKKEAILEIKTGNVSYTVPASQINIDNVSQQIGKQVELKDIKVSVKIADTTTETAKVITDTANKNSYQIVVKPVEFEITCTSGSNTVDVSRFNGYVERIVAIPEGIDPSKITTGIVLNTDGTFRHVPTQITVINGKYYAKINSLTNSTYSVIYNPVTFADAAKHWAKDAINDMGSRLVVTGVGNGDYNPNKNITRAEFAAIAVRALGLAPGIGENNFSDVPSSAWYCGYIETAASYGIIKGYDTSRFGPGDTITREQAMAMIARSMKMTGLKAELSEEQAAGLLNGYKDGNTASGYAKQSIAACLKNGVVSGVGNNKIAPKDEITRAEVAAMFQRLLQKSELI